MKKISTSIRNLVFAICSLIVLLNLALSGIVMRDTYFDFTYKWLQNQNKVFESVIDNFFYERKSDINTLASNSDLMSHLVSGNSFDQKEYLNTFMLNYEYQSLLVLNERKEKIYYEYDYGVHDKEHVMQHATSFAKRLDQAESGSVLFEYFLVDERLFGVVAKKSSLRNGKVFYYFLVVNSKHLNKILFTSSFYVDGAVSYLINKHDNGNYYFLTDVIQDGRTYSYGDKSDRVPLYWKYAEQGVEVDSFVYKDLADEHSLVAYTKITELGEDLILISKIQSKYIVKSLLDTFYYIIFVLIVVFLLVWLYSNRIKFIMSTNMNNLMGFCSDLIKGEKNRRLIVSDYYEINALKDSLLEVAEHLDEDKVRKGYEIKMEKELRLSTSLEEFSRKSIVIFREMFDINFAAFYYRADDEFKLMTQYFSSMGESIPLEHGVVGQCYELNKVLQVKGSVFEKNEVLKGACLDLGSQALFPEYYIFIPVVASKESLASGMLVCALNKELNNSQLEFLEKTRVNLALIMSFVAQRENLNTRFEHTKRREEELDQLNEELTLLSRNDSLTGISNRFYGEYLLDKTLKNKRFSREPLSVLMFDVDHFKAYNDTYGHVAGDKCLQQIAQCLSEMGFRNDDFFFRYGGEEFVVVLPNTVTKNAVQVAERLRKTVQDLKIPHESSPTFNFVTISIGVYTLAHSVTHIKNVEQLFQKVDKNLYLAKDKRNSVSSGEIES